MEGVVQRVWYGGCGTEGAVRRVLPLYMLWPFSFVGITETQLIAVDLKDLRFLQGAGATAQATDGYFAGSVCCRYKCLKICRLKSPLFSLHWTVHPTSELVCSLCC